MSERSLKSQLRSAFGNMLRYVRWLGVLLVVLYLCSGIYSISSNEIGVLHRFGKVVDDKVPPGIHYALPWPVDSYIRVPIKQVSRLEVDDFYAGEGVYCITGDNNLVNVDCVIQYQVTAPMNALYQVDDSRLMLKKMVSSAIIHSISQMSIDEALTTGKQEIARQIGDELQHRLDEVRCGLSVSFVELRDIKVPQMVQKSFSDVVKAKIEKEKLVNDAQSYANEKYSSSKASADKLLQQAHAYKREVVLNAEGETQRYEALRARIRKEGTAALDLIYIENMQQILSQVGSKHILASDKTGQLPAELKLNINHD